MLARHSSHESVAVEGARDARLFSGDQRVLQRPDLGFMLFE